MPLAQVVVDQLFRNAIRMLSDGKSEEDVIHHITSNGMPLSDALSMINEAKKAKIKVVRQHGMGTMLSGVALIILGLIITVGTHSMPVAGHYVIMTGGLFFGGIFNFFIGLWSLVFKRRII